MLRKKLICKLVESESRNSIVKEFTGTMGAGKTSVLGEASELLTPRQIVHAAIDVDALGLAHLPSVISKDEAMYCNLRSVCKNYTTSA